MNELDLIKTDRNYNVLYSRLTGTTYLFSYTTLVAKISKDGAFIKDGYEKYSRTTSRHLARFFKCETAKEIKDALKNSKIKRF